MTYQCATVFLLLFSSLIQALTLRIYPSLDTLMQDYTRTSDRTKAKTGLALDLTWLQHQNLLITMSQQYLGLLAKSCVVFHKYACTIYYGIVLLCLVHLPKGPLD